jgi:hypothetical protein
MSTSASALKQISDEAASPERASSPVRDAMVKVTGELKDQLCSRILWTYLVLGIVLLAVCFYFFATAKSDVSTYIGTRPSGVPGFVDNPWFVYTVVTIVGVLFVYGMYRGYIAAKHSSARYALNLVFAFIATLIIVWFYNFYMKGKLMAYISTEPNTGNGNRTPFFIAISLIVLLVLQFFLLWNTGDRLAAYTVVPLLVAISLFAWASWELSVGVEETW